MKLYLYTDGSAIGNPGAAGIAYLLKSETGTALAFGYEPIGVATNNQAEYRALLRGLKAVNAHSPTVIEWFSDSELLVKQWIGAYQIRDAQLRQLMHQAKMLAHGVRIVPHIVPRNSLPEMRQVDQWARAAARQQIHLQYQPREQAP